MLTDVRTATADKTNSTCSKADFYLLKPSECWKETDYRVLIFTSSYKNLLTHLKMGQDISLFALVYLYINFCVRSFYIPIIYAADRLMQI